MILLERVHLFLMSATHSITFMPDVTSSTIILNYVLSVIWCRLLRRKIAGNLTMCMSLNWGGGRECECLEKTHTGQGRGSKKSQASNSNKIILAVRQLWLCDCQPSMLTQSQQRNDQILNPTDFHVKMHLKIWENSSWFLVSHAAEQTQKWESLNDNFSPSKYTHRKTVSTYGVCVRGYFHC